MSVSSKTCLSQESLQFSMSGPWSYQVTSKSGEHYHFVLDQCTCTCLRYTLLRISCDHALAATIHYGINLKGVVVVVYPSSVF